MDQSFRGFLAALEQRGEVQRIKRKVDPRFELASVLMLRDNGPAQIFENVAGYNMPLVAHVLNSRARFADALGVPYAELEQRLQSALQNPIPPILVREAPVQPESLEITRPNRSSWAPAHRAVLPPREWPITATRSRAMSGSVSK